MASSTVKKCHFFLFRGLGLVLRQKCLVFLNPFHFKLEHLVKTDTLRSWVRILISLRSCGQPRKRSGCKFQPRKIWRHLFSRRLGFVYPGLFQGVPAEKKQAVPLEIYCLHHTSQLRHLLTLKLGLWNIEAVLDLFKNLIFSSDEILDYQSENLFKYEDVFLILLFGRFRKSRVRFLENYSFLWV